MNQRISTSADVTRAISAAIFASDGNVGIEVLVLRNLDQGLDAAADALGLAIIERPDDVTPSALRPLVARLFGDGEEEIGTFLDQVVFTRQIPIEQSPIENWSLVDLWTQLSGVVGGAGFAHMAGASPVVLVIAGAFGTLLMRPLTSISKGVALGLEEPVREATETFAREWLSRHQTGTTRAVSLGDKIPVDNPDRLPVTDAPLTPEEEWEREKFELQQQIEGVERDFSAALLDIPAHLRAARKELSERGASDAATQFDALLLEVDAEIKKIEPTGGGTVWAKVPESIETLKQLSAQLEPIADKGAGAGRYHHKAADAGINTLARLLWIHERAVVQYEQFSDD